MPFKSKQQAKFLFSQKPKIAKEFSKKTKSFKKLPEKADGGNLGEFSGADDALFKEHLPRPKRVNTADIWLRQQKGPMPDRKGLEYGNIVSNPFANIESSSEEDTLLGRLAKRMASRDYIDNLDLGTRTSKQVKAARETSEDGGDSGASKVVKEISNNTIPTPKGAGRHIQMDDVKAVNFSNPIPQGAVLPGNNMASQAKNAGNVVGNKGNVVDKPYSG